MNDICAAQHQIFHGIVLVLGSCENLLARPGVCLLVAGKK
jgi:hypothetical protein